MVRLGQILTLLTLVFLGFFPEYSNAQAPAAPVVQKPAAAVDKHLALAREFVLISDLINEIDSVFRTVDIRIGNLKKKPGCEKGTECRKAVDAFEVQHVNSKEQNKNILIDQFATNLKANFNEKELEWLVTVYNAPTYKKYKNYLSNETGRPGTKYSQVLNEKLDKDVQKFIGSPAKKK